MASRQPGLAEHGRQRDVAARRKQRSHALLGLSCQRDQHRAEEVDLAMRDRADDEARRQVAAHPEMRDQRGMILRARAVDQRQRSLHAGVLEQALGAGCSHQRDDQRRALQRLAELDQQHVAAVGRQPPVGDQRLAQRRDMAVALGHAAEADSDAIVGPVIGDQRRGRRPPRRPRRSPPTVPSTRTGRSAMSFCIAFAPDATRSIRSASVSSGERASTTDATSGWSAASALTICSGAWWLQRQRFGHRLAHFCRGVVEQQRQCGFRRAAILERQVVLDIGARERSGGGRPLVHPCRMDPFQEMRDDHQSLAPRD